jgi:hypothetical protein
MTGRMLIRILHTAPAGLTSFNEQEDHDIAQFSVCRPPFPPHDLMSHLLNSECDEWSLIRYDPSSGIGEFMTLDSDAPARDSNIILDASIPMPRPATIIYIVDPE